MAIDIFVNQASDMLTSIQAGLFASASDRVAKQTVQVESAEAFREAFARPDAGFVKCYAADGDTCAAVLDELKVTPQCMPLNDASAGACIFTGAPNARLTIFARNY